VACSVADVVRRFRERHGEHWELFPEKVALQLNDTHPALAIAELMRVFLDEIRLPWDRAWALTRATCGYTQHTVLAEALETWPVNLANRLIPRHVQIIFDINRRFLEEVGTLQPGNADRLRRVSLVQETAIGASAWRTWRSWGATGSTGWRVSTPSSSRKRCSGSSPRCGRTVSSRSPTGSRPGAGCWPATLASPSRSPQDRRRVGATSNGFATSSRSPTIPHSRRVPRHQARQQGGARLPGTRALRRGDRPGLSLRRPDQTHARVQTAAPERHAHHRALPASEGEPAHRGESADVHLRGQGPRPPTGWRSW